MGYESDRALIKALARHTRNEDYIKCTLDSIASQEDRERLIEYLDRHENLSISLIELRVMELTGVIESGVVDPKEILELKRIEGIEKGSMINVWDYQDIDDEVQIDLADGRYVVGVISSIDDEEESGFGEDGITLCTPNGRIVGLRQSEIASITIVNDRIGNTDADQPDASAYMLQYTATALCRAWTKGDPVLLEYHDHEWCKVCHEDQMQFELLCLEGASVGLSWRTILYKRAAYRAAFHGFDIDACAAMPDAELEALLQNPGLIRNRGKIYGVRQNARVVQAIQRECGSLDAYLWGMADGQVIDGHWSRPEEMPTVSELSRRLSADLKRRGMCYVGPVITYSFLQSIGIVNDHLQGCCCR